MKTLKEILNDSDIRHRASCMIEFTSDGTLGPTGWNVKDRIITSELIPLDKVNSIRHWYINGVKVKYEYCLLLTYRLLKLI
jgi:hypothetical protein